ncbi:MAG TPA: nucleotide exchange factor GrpE [Acidimicrobiia bacterium]|nr:nucleotide exchange factor GrpE [Acidimicrobiia bacterium]
MSDDLLEGAAAQGEVVVGEIVDDGMSRDLPEDPEAAVAYLLEALRTAQEEATAYLGDLQRVAAEFENYRKRAMRERDEIVARATQALIRDLLPVLDSFDGALESAAATPGDERLLAGVRSTHRLLMDVLAREGLEVIPAAGMPFDPAVHEAATGGGTGHLVVTAEMRRGYSLRGRVLRPALVGVAADDPGGGD